MTSLDSASLTRPRAAESAPATDRARSPASSTMHPRFHLDVLRWFATLTRVAGVDPADLTVHVVGSTRSEALDYLGDQGVRVVGVEGFDPRSPHCNKISGARQLAADGVERAGRALRHRRGNPRRSPSLGPVPPDRWRRSWSTTRIHPSRCWPAMFTAAGARPAAARSRCRGIREVHGGGKRQRRPVPDPGPAPGPVADGWESWARWLLDRPELLGQLGGARGPGGHGAGAGCRGRRSDATRCPMEHPGPRARPHPRRRRRAGRHPLPPRGRCRRGHPVDRIGADRPRIDAANEAIEPVWHRAFPNATFWQWRYLTDPASRIGVGSRGCPSRASGDCWIGAARGRPARVGARRRLRRRRGGSGTFV